MTPNKSLQQDPFAGAVFVFRNSRGTAIKAIVYDGQGFWLCHKRLSEGCFRWWPSSCDGGAKQLRAHQLSVLFSAGEVLHNDDTTARILELMGKRREQLSDSTASTRTGLFTSGVVAVRAGKKVALFFSGRQHAGENLSDVLKHRDAELARPIQMCDALSRNLTADLETIVANCLAHAR